MNFGIVGCSRWGKWVIVTGTLALVSLALGAVQIAARAATASDVDNPAQIVISGMQAREAKITSLSTDYELETQEFTDPALEARRDPDLGSVMPRQVWNGRFAFDGNRFYEEQQLAYPTAGKTTWKAFDGNLGRYFDSATSTGMEVAPEEMDSSAAGGSQVGSWLYVAHNFASGERPESDLVVRSEAAVEDSEVSLDGLRCYLLEAAKQTEKESYERHWWVAPERDWAVVKFEGITFLPGDSLIASRKLTRQVESWTEVNGVWMPTTITHKIEVTLTGGRTVLVKSDKLTLTYQSANTSLPLTVFQPPFPAGTLVAALSGTDVVGE